MCGEKTAAGRLIRPFEIKSEMVQNTGDKGWIDRERNIMITI